ncbi:MAG: hypothetical protein H6708_19175 [Kofleriaceae bacterium]|nr:hypothetical protein [Kofleriaceae bacterium]
MTEDLRGTFDRIASDVRRMVDEVRVKVHLAGMDARDAWTKLEPQLARFEAQASKATSEVSAELQAMGTELKQQLEKLRDRVRDASAN